MERRSVRPATELGLPPAGIDLRERPDGAWVCFEVNPMPAYSYYESHTGQPSAAAIVDLLAGAPAALEVGTVVAPVENLTALRVRLLAATPHPRLPGWEAATVEVLSATPVPGRADLLSQRVGESLDLAVRQEQLAGLPTGSVLRLRARLAVGEVLAEQAPAPGDFGVEPGL
ncbi:hypothetical protein KCMC57_up09270 [Kitasatospora sp. CMC57]|uniref:ATP-grasp domain-containing protein n=1 Tax=Kitasatospora sp. CMC57 TaxID=3231513 RepID=A0AB33JVH5_9ACTN